MARRQYTEDEKAVALVMLTACDGNVKKAAKKLDIPVMTLWKWSKGKGVNSAVTEKENVKKADLADLWEREVRAALEEARLAREAAGYNGLILAAATATDKMRLMRDQPTSINKNENYDADDEAILAAADVIRSERERLPSLAE